MGAGGWLAVRRRVHTVSWRTLLPDAHLWQQRACCTGLASRLTAPAPATSLSQLLAALVAAPLHCTGGAGGNAVLRSAGTRMACALASWRACPVPALPSACPRFLSCLFKPRAWQRLWLCKGQRLQAYIAATLCVPGPSLNPAFTFGWEMVYQQQSRAEHLAVFWVAPVAAGLFGGW